jgi:hypothetical protein
MHLSYQPDCSYTGWQEGDIPAPLRPSAYSPHRLVSAHHISLDEFCSASTHSLSDDETASLDHLCTHPLLSMRTVISPGPSSPQQARLTALSLFLQVSQVGLR